MTPIVNCDNIVRAIHLARIGNLNVTFLFQENISAVQRREVNTYVAQYCNVTNLENADIVLEYLPPYDLVEHFNYQIYFPIATTATPLEILTLDTLNKAGHTLLKTAYERLGYETFDVERIMKIAKTIATLGQYDCIALEHLAEAIMYRSFDRELLKSSWTNEELAEILKSMQWEDEYARWRFTGDYEDLPPSAQHEWEGIMWGWQDCISMFKTKINLNL